MVSITTDNIKRVNKEIILSYTLQEEDQLLRNISLRFIVPWLWTELLPARGCEWGITIINWHARALGDTFMRMRIIVLRGTS